MLTLSQAAGRLQRTLVVHAEFARVGFTNMLAYRLRYYTGVVTYFIYVSVYYFIWKAVYSQGGTLAGFSLRQMITYVAVGWIARSFYFNNIDQDMYYDVVEGKLAMELIKPANVQWMRISSAWGESLFRLLMLTPPAAALIAIVFPLQPPASGVHFALFCLSVALSFFIVATMNFAVGTFALRLKSILGLLRAKFLLFDLLSGLLIPITLFPPAAQKVLGWLPFMHISYSPLLIYLGKVHGSEIAKILGVQAFWIVVLLVIGDVWWRASSRTITIHGG
jgi:ABC-2 type transport system permease protein